MLPRKSKLPAQPVERPILAPHWLTAMLATMVGGSLWLMYPRQDLERRLTASPRESGLSYVYLSNLLRSDPENPRLQALMAQHEAKEEAARLAREAEEARVAEMQSANPWTLWSAAMDEYHAIDPQDTALRSATRAELVERLNSLLAGDVPPGMLPKLAGHAFQLDERALGIRLYQQMAAAAHVPSEASQLYRRAARESLAMSSHAQAAELFLAARRNTADPEQAKALYLDALAAMQASGKPAAALDLAQRELGTLENDPQVLRALVDLARAAGKPAVAERYVKRLLQLALLQQWQRQAFAHATEASGYQQMSGAMAAMPTPTGRYEDRAYLLDPALLHHPKTAGGRMVRTAQADAGAKRQVPAYRLTTRLTPWATRCFWKIATSKTHGWWPVPPCSSLPETLPGESGWPSWPSGRSAARSRSKTGW